MKFLKSLAFACVTASVFLLAQAVHAAPPPEKRVNQAERAILTVPFNVSSTIYAANKYAVASPVKGYVTGMYVVYEGPNAVTSGTAAVIQPKIGGVSVTVISTSVPSGTAVLGAISSTTSTKSTNNDVAKGQVIELVATGSPIMTGTGGGAARVVLEVTPDYTENRFQQ